MIEITHTEVMNMEAALRGMRNALNSWDKADSNYILDEKTGKPKFIIGSKDLTLAKKLILAGASSHRKFLRQIFVSFDITAPIYFWKEFDTYKIGVVRNSTSTMHKLASTPITKECFSFDDTLDSLDTQDYTTPAKDWLPYISVGSMNNSIIRDCELLRTKYLNTKDNRYWEQLIRLLPNAWNQKSTISLNYEVLRAQYFDRRNHKLKEWHEYCDWIKTLPYADSLITLEKGGN